MRFLLHAIGDMAVDVKRKRGGGVTNVLLYGFDVVTILQREHGVGMPKVVKTNIWHGMRVGKSRSSFWGGMDTEIRR